MASPMNWSPTRSNAMNWSPTRMNSARNIQRMWLEAVEAERIHARLKAIRKKMALRTIGRAVRKRKTKRNEIKSRQNKRVNAFRAEMNKLAREKAESQARKNYWTNIFRTQGRGPLFNALGIAPFNELTTRRKFLIHPNRERNLVKKNIKNVLFKSF